MRHTWWVLHEVWGRPWRESVWIDANGSRNRSPQPKLSPRQSRETLDGTSAVGHLKKKTLYMKASKDNNKNSFRFVSWIQARQAPGGYVLFEKHRTTAANPRLFFFTGKVDDYLTRTSRYWLYHEGSWSAFCYNKIVQCFIGRVFMLSYVSIIFVEKKYV